MTCTTYGHLGLALTVVVAQLVAPIGWRTWLIGSTSRTLRWLLVKRGQLPGGVSEEPLLRVDGRITAAVNAGPHKADGDGTACPAPAGELSDPAANGAGGAAQCLSSIGACRNELTCR